VFSGVFIAEDVDGVGDNRTGDNTAIDVQTHLNGFLNVSLKSACFLMKLFFLSQDYSPQVLDYQDFQIIRCQITGILLYFI